MGIPTPDFDAIDEDGAGMLLFDEFAAWAIPMAMKEELEWLKKVRKAKKDGIPLALIPVKGQELSPEKKALIEKAQIAAKAAKEEAKLKALRKKEKAAEAEAKKEAEKDSAFAKLLPTAKTEKEKKKRDEM